ncbi:MAG: hypothetical protein ABUL61_02580, partial [Oleiharenicola lentus]
MKPAGYLLLIPVGLAGIAEAASEPAPTGLASRELKAHIREGLPAYQSPAANRPAQEGDSPIFTENHATTDPDVLILPKLTVKERRDLPSDATRYLMGARNYDR